MHSLIFPVGMLCLVILLLIFFLRRFNQPYMIAYILAGVLIGPFAGGIFTNVEDTAALGEIGVLLMMFFIGMEMDVPDEQNLLLKPLIAQLMKMLLAVVFAFVLGNIFHWPANNILLVSMLFMFNSTAVVSEYLSRNGELHTPFGKMILNILVLQDVLLAPVLLVLQFVGTNDISYPRLIMALVASAVIFLLLRAMRNRNLIRPAYLKEISSDHELQVFLGGTLCLGFALLAEASGLSGAVGSFVAGMLIGRTPAFHWLEHALKPFRVFFVSFFFVSIGLRLDLDFIHQNYLMVLMATLLLFASNSLLSSIIFRVLHYKWPNSIYGGALLSQTGEFGIIACSLAYQMNIINEDLFKTGIAITALSLLFSTTWIFILRKFGMAVPA